jgi:hypothetical protein
MEDIYQNRKSELLFTLLDPSYLNQMGALKQQKRTGLKQNHVKNIFLTQVKFLYEIDEQTFHHFYATIEQNEHKVDFHLIVLIRFLFLTSSSTDSSLSSSSSSPWSSGPLGDVRDGYLQQLQKILSNFIFWPTMMNSNKSTSPTRNTATSRIANYMGFGDPATPSTSAFTHCFWSENHIFMFLSSAVLFYEKCQLENLPCLVTEKEVKLLLIYLTAHVEFHGVYETLSHIYLPYTLASLLNLYDFSTNTQIRNLSFIMINNIIEQFLVCTNSDGVSTYTPSTRQFNKTQTRSWGHNVNSLIFLLTGQPHLQPQQQTTERMKTNTINPTPLLDFLLTSSWSPSEILSRSFEMKGYRQQVVCHPTSMIREIYSKLCHDFEISPLELVPFYWCIFSFSFTLLSPVLGQLV